MARGSSTGLALLAVATALFAGGCAKHRTITVTVAVDETVRAHPDWERGIRERLATVSDLYKGACAIRWKVDRIAAWDTPTTDSAEALRTSLTQTFANDRAEVVVGISGRRFGTGGTGIAAPFDRYAVVLNYSVGDKHRDAAAIGHELAHLFGAMHSREAGSLMHASAPGLRVDAKAAAALRVMRSFDFRRGPEAMDFATWKHAADTYASDRPDAARAYQEFAAMLADRQAWAHAANLLTAAALTHKDASLLLQRGMIQKSASQWDDAEKSFVQALELSPDLFEAHHQAGILAGQRGDSRRAIAYLRRAAELHPAGAQIRYNLGVALSATVGGLANAEEQFTATLALQPDHAGAQRAVRDLRLLQDSLEAAVAKWRRSVQTHPSDPVHHYNLAVALSKLGRLREAEIEYRRALALRPGFHRARENLAVVLHASGRFREAFDEIERLRQNGASVNNELAAAVRELVREPPSDKQPGKPERK